MTDVRPLLAYRLALVTAGATLALIVLGGLVTNTGAGLAVPDWPTTFGHNMFLYPWSQMVGGIFFEHSHRLVGSVVGVLTLLLAAALWRLGSTFRMFGIVAVAAVVLQGVLGGLRVVLLKDTLALVHGCLAQAFFALIVTIAVLASPAMRSVSRVTDASLQGFTLAAAALVYLQIVFGALLTHAGRIDLHLAGAILVFAFVPIVTARLRRSGDPVAAPFARLLVAALGVQLLLGIGSFLARFSSIALPGGQVTVVILPVAHRLIGSVILGTAVAIAVRVAAGLRVNAWEPAASIVVARSAS